MADAATEFRSSRSGAFPGCSGMIASFCADVGAVQFAWMPDGACKDEEHGHRNVRNIQTCMRTTLIRLLFVFCCHFSYGADTEQESTKSSSKKEFDAPKEIKSFYGHLLDKDTRVKKQFEVLTSRSREDAGGTFHVFDPQVIEWFPAESHWNVSTGFDSDKVYLVIQLIGFGRGRADGDDNAVISLFRVQHTGTTTYDEATERAGASPKLITNTITITFLGFQNLKLTALKLPTE
jgi:hypothetical protein